MMNAFKFKIIIFFLLVVFTGLTTKIYGQQRPVSNISDLNFGEFYPTSGGYIDIDASGTVTTSGVVYLGGASNAKFSVRATGKERFINITIMNPVVQLTRVGGGQMTLTVGPVSHDRYWHTGGNNTREISVGGRLAVESILSNPAGNYNGEINITVDYP